MRILSGARLRLGSWLMRLGLRVAGDEVLEGVEEDEGGRGPGLDPGPHPVVEVGERGRELLASGRQETLARMREPEPEVLEGSVAARRARAGLRGAR